ncbi:MAG: hypothetical protein R6X12_09355 [bacterium]
MTARADAVANLRAFARLYGYARFFHPSDEASSIDWARLAVLGAARVLDCADAGSLRSTLAGLFGPVAPTVQVCGAGTGPRAPELSGDDATCLPVCWQHRGLRLPEAERFLEQTYGTLSVYSSLRTNRPMHDGGGDLPAFGDCPAPGEYVDKPLDRELACRVPLCIWSKYGETLPFADTTALERLQAALDAVELDPPGDPPPDVRLGAVVIAWTAARHFYPYFDVVPTDWDAVLTETLAAALDATDRAGFHRTLRRMAVALHDGHAGAVDLRRDDGVVRARLEFVEERVVVVAAAADTGLRRGDVLLEVDGRPVDRLLKEEEQHVSGSPQWRRARSLNRLLLGPKTASLSLLVERGTDTIRASAMPGDPSRPFPPDTGECVRELEPGIWYVDLNRALDEINSNLRKLARARGVIFDLRGYPNRNEGVLGYLLTGEEKRGEKWMFISRTAWPDRERISGWDGFGWEHIRPDEPHFRGRAVFLADSSAISYAESVLGYVEGFRLGEIVGSPTAGANGNILLLPLPGAFRFSWTGMKVTRFDGSQHHLLGIRPTVPVRRTLRALREGRDEHIEKALKLLR